MTINRHSSPSKTSKRTKQQNSRLLINQPQPMPTQKHRLEDVPAQKRDAKKIIANVLNQDCRAQVTVSAQRVEINKNYFLIQYQRQHNANVLKVIA